MAIFRLKTDRAIAGVDNLVGRLLTIKHISDYAGPLMQNWERAIEADNRQGVLAGLDKDGNPAAPLRYRGQQRVGGGKSKLTVAQRLGQRPNKRRGEYMGHGPAASGLNNNLTTSQYRKLNGPRLAPRRQFSRVITNLLTGHGRDPMDPSQWFAEGAWHDVVSAKGVHFLLYHFSGTSRLPRYDLRGVRPEGRAKLLDSFREWAKLEIRERYNRRNDSIHLSA